MVVETRAQAARRRMRMQPLRRRGMFEYEPDTPWICRLLHVIACCVAMVALAPFLLFAGVSESLGCNQRDNHDD